MNCRCPNLIFRSLAIAVFVTSCAPSSPGTTLNGTGGGMAAGSGGATDVGTGGGGTPGTGGSLSIGTGGATSTGGSSATGGTSSTGGMVSSGGQTGSGGMSATGGANSGGAGQAGATGSGGAGGTVVSANCPAGALLCEDFEAYAAMAVPSAANGKWTSRTNGAATVVVDATHPHSGTKAAHFHAATVSNNQRAYLLTQGAPVFPVAGDTLYVRFMMYIGRYVSVSGTSIHNRIAWVGSAATLSSGGNGPGYAFVTYNGIAIERLTNPSQGFQRDTGQHLDDVSRQNKWQCFEFEIDNKGGVPAGEQSSSTTMPHIWQEGVELKLAAAGSSEAWVPAPFEALQFSLWCPQTDPMPTDYWIDDIVMSNQRIKCPPAQ